MPRRISRGGPAGCSRGGWRGSLSRRRTGSLAEPQRISRGGRRGALAEPQRISGGGRRGSLAEPRRISRAEDAEDLSPSAAACLACGLDDWHLNGERAPFAEQAEGHGRADLGVGKQPFELRSIVER